MDKKFLISVCLSVATVMALQYLWNRKPVASGEVSVQGAQGQPKPGEAIKVPVKEDLYKPMQIGFSLVGDVGIVDSSAVASTSRVEAVVSTRAGALTELRFKECLGKDKKPMATISKDEKQDESSYGSFVVAFEGAAPLNYSLVPDEIGSVSKHLAVRAIHEGWEVTKKYSFGHP